MNKENEYRIRRAYVEKVLALALKPKTGFDYIRYAKEAHTDREFIRIADKRGTHITLEVTAQPLEEIMQDVFKIALFGIMGKHDRITVPGNIITDGAALLELAPIFNNRTETGVRYGL